MPYSKFKKSKFGYAKRKKSGKSKRGIARMSYRKRGKEVFLTPKGQIGLPKRIFAKLRYTETGLDVSTAAATYRSLKTFRAQSLYDPNYSDAGNQPLYFDQLSAMYSNYRVRGAKITCYLRTTTASNSCYEIKSLIFPSLGAVDVSGNAIKDVIATKHAKCIRWNIERGYNKSVKLSAYVNPNKFINLDPKHLDSSALYNANPVNNVMFNIIHDTSQGSSASAGVAAAIYMDVKIVYYCEFFNPITIASS